ncbi:Planctomycete cytochrome C [Anatilimnocola aggregata]|uniref:Planctomycete cytochrome C n=1 Tax=Anatilimnocola aggregata TaxID=2528021 RepID=A0A517YFW8_9BACT|nr:PSD1 and planctomycete cytochrome C domain-containing protein [Anatilimnocola aggregata]QDU29123.1 Planctomycete cytochrome C [Anatilimnocola aggregata]
MVLSRPCVSKPNGYWLKVLPAMAVVCVLSPLAHGAEPAADARGIEFFEKKIRPVLVEHCYECHSAKSKIVQGNLYLDSREGSRRGGDSGPAVVPAKGDESLILEALRHDSFEMPPKGKLPDAVIADFVKWIDLGAPDPREGAAPALKVVDIEAGRKFWSFQPPQRHSLPSVMNEAWTWTDIDRYVLAKLEEKSLRPAPDAERALLIRRLTFDLIGLPPTPEEIADFLADRSPLAVAKVVDRLLATPQFGERWGRHWLDVARYAESSGKERNVPYRMAWRYRDYVIDALNADMPYDQFIREQIAGDLLPADSTAERDRQLIATGFLAIGPQALTERVPEQFLLDVADEQLDATCRAFLASTAACARCHDHKFDPIPTTDYYGLIGIFRSTELLAGVQPLRREFSYARAAALGDEAQRLGPSRDLQTRIAKLERELDVCRNKVRDANKTKDPPQIELAKQAEAKTFAALTDLRSQAEGAEIRYAMAVRDVAQPVDYAVRIRGELDDLGPVVPRRFISVLTSERTRSVNRQHSGRLELAAWIASRDNPLTARVMVNRLWQHLFGTGLVESTDNFGLTGEKPSHPELLDYLSLRFMDEGWSIKRAIRTIVLSRVYQLSDQRDAAAYALDPGNRLLWRFGRRRLEAEAIRDAILFASGELDLRRPVNSETLKLPNLELGSTARLMAADDSLRCRGVYLPMLRNNVPGMLGLFDMADPSLVIGRREVTSVATQALYLMNSKFVMDQAKSLARRLLDEEPADVAARLELAYRRTLTRSPTAEEQRQVWEFVEQARANPSSKVAKSQVEIEAWANVCQALFGSAEFLYVH